MTLPCAKEDYTKHPSILNSHRANMARTVTVLTNLTQIVIAIPIRAQLGYSNGDVT